MKDSNCKRIIESHQNQQSLVEIKKRFLLQFERFHRIKISDVEKIFKQIIVKMAIGITANSLKLIKLNPLTLTVICSLK